MFLTRIAGQSDEHTNWDHERMEKGDAEVDEEVEHCDYIILIFNVWCIYL